MRGGVKRGANLRAEFAFVSIEFCLFLKISIRFYTKEEEISIGFCFGEKNKILFLIYFFF